LGAVLGVALLVSILGAPTSPDAALVAFHHAWIMCVVAGLLCAALALCHARPSMSGAVVLDLPLVHASEAG
jgi:hypothetical protein